MKVVLFCGGFGMRMREYSELIPKPLVKIGYRPILWHLMKHYSDYGHREFILCLGWRGDAIKDFFLNYNECVSNNFVLNGEADQVQLLNRDIADWKITFVDTGIMSNIGQRLQIIKPYLGEDELFFANYADGLSDIDLDSLVTFNRQTQAVGTFLSVSPSQSFHLVESNHSGIVTAVRPATSAGIWINGGYFVLSREIFRYMQPGEELVEQPFQRLIQEGRLSTVRHSGFWGCIDTYKELQVLQEMFDRGETPWIKSSAHDLAPPGAMGGQSEKQRH